MEKIEAQSEIKFHFGLGYWINHTALHFRLSFLQACKIHGFDITPEQMGILYLLTIENGLYQRQISKLLLKDRPNMTRMIDILEKMNYVYREADPKDRRIIKVFITDEGRKRAAEMIPVARSVGDKAREGVSDEELEIFCRVMNKLCQNLENSFKMQI